MPGGRGFHVRLYSMSLTVHAGGTCVCARARSAARVCGAAHRRPDAPGVPWLPYETDPQIPTARLVIRMRVWPRRDAAARSAPDARAAARLSHAAGRDRATLSHASVAKLRAARERLSRRVAMGSEPPTI